MDVPLPWLDVNMKLKFYILDYLILIGNTKYKRNADWECCGAWRNSSKK